MSSNYDWLEELLSEASPGPWEVKVEETSTCDDLIEGLAAWVEADNERVFGCGMEIEEDEELANLALAPALAREVLRTHKVLPAPSRGMTPHATVWYLAGPIGDIRAMGEHVVVFGHGHEHSPFRVVLTSAEAEAIAGALLAAANRADGQRWIAMDSDETETENNNEK